MFDFFKARNYEYMGTLTLVIVKEGEVTTEGWCSYLIYPDWLLIPSKCIDLKRIDRSLQMNKNENHESLIFLIFTLNNMKNGHETKERTGKNLYFGLLNWTLKNIWFIRITGLLLNFRLLDWRFHYCRVKIRTQSTWSVQNQRTKRIEILLVNTLLKKHSLRTDAWLFR